MYVPFLKQQSELKAEKWVWRKSDQFLKKKSKAVQIWLLRSLEEVSLAKYLFVLGLLKCNTNLRMLMFFGSFDLLSSVPLAPFSHPVHCLQSELCLKKKNRTRFFFAFLFRLCDKRVVQKVNRGNLKSIPESGERFVFEKKGGVLSKWINFFFFRALYTEPAMLTSGVI